MNALILVDLQNDFIPGGALEVPKGDQVIAPTNRLIPSFDLVVATQDWHPANHGSFAVNHTNKMPGEVIELNGISQVLWPAHCVQHTQGAEFVSELDTSRITRVFTKGTDPCIDSYSGFFDNGHKRATGMGDYLKEQGVKEIYVLGLALDYCVKFTALDGRYLDFHTTVIRDACRAVNLQPGDDERALQELEAAGVRLALSEEILAEMNNKAKT